MNDVKRALGCIGFCLFLFIAVKIIIFLLGYLSVAMSVVSNHLMTNWSIYLSIISLVILCASVFSTYGNVTDKNMNLNFIQKIRATVSQIFKNGFQAILTIILFAVVLGLFFFFLGGALECIRLFVFRLFN